MSVQYNTSLDKSDIRVAIIGCGNWGKNLTRVFYELKVLAAVCDHEDEKAKRLSVQYGATVCDLAQILQTKEINAVVIATPSHTHEALTELCLKANKHVFVEKPFTLNADASLRLDQLASSKNRILMVGHLLHYHAAFQRLKMLQQTDLLGPLQCIYAHRTNFGKYPTESSVLWDFAPHDISMILSLVDTMPYRVSATTVQHLQHTKQDSVFIHLYFQKNIQAHIFASWLYPIKEQKFTVVGKKNMAVFEDSKDWENKLVLYPYPHEWNDGLPSPFTSSAQSISLTPSEPLKDECQHFLESIASHSSPVTNAKEASQVITILEAAMHSIEVNQPVSIAFCAKKKEPMKQDAVSPFS